MRFSVIVPVYGVEKYLEECVSSLLSQTFGDFEILLVDDKSPDNCPAICDKLAESDSRIRVIHKTVNEGLGFARNTGIAAAAGDYVLFVDSDDTIELNTLEICEKHLTDSPDILVYGMTLCYENDKGKTVRTEDIIPEDFYADGKALMGEMFKKLSNSRVFQYACNKAYKREFLSDAATQFEKTKLIEDFIFNIDIFGKCSKVRSINYSFYNYRKPTHVTLASSYNPEFFNLAKRKFNLEKEFLENCQAYDGECKQQVLINHIKHIVSAAIRNGSNAANLSAREQKKLLKEMINDPVTQYVLSEIKTSEKQYAVIVSRMKKKQIDLLLMFCKGVDFLQHKIFPLIKK